MESQSEQSESQGSSARLRKGKQRATASEESKAKVRKADRERPGRNNVDSRNVASTGRAIFQMTKSSKLREAFYCALCVYLVTYLKCVHVENDHRNSLITLAMNVALLRFFYHSTALHKMVLLVFVPFPYDAHFLSYENHHSFSIDRPTE